jgi:hypothetical protein
MSIEVMKQALEALNTCRVMGADDDGNYTKEITPKVITSAITALRQAIEQAEKQEPVAWMAIENYVDADGLWETRNILNFHGDGTPLYTRPPTAPAQPLTDKQIDALGVRGIEQFPTLSNLVPWGAELMPYVRQLTRAIEAHHSIKGASL